MSADGSSVLEPGPALARTKACHQRQPGSEQQDRGRLRDRRWSDGEILGGELRHRDLPGNAGQVGHPGEDLQIRRVVGQVGGVHEPRQVQAAVEIDEESRAGRGDLLRKQVGRVACAEGRGGVVVVIERPQDRNVGAGSGNAADAAVGEVDVGDEGKEAALEREDVGGSGERDGRRSTAYRMTATRLSSPAR